MHPKTTRQIMLPEDFYLPFGGTLNPENRWVKMAAIIPWWDLEDRYAKHFKTSRRGEKAFTVRVALGALIIQTRLNLTDRETVDQIMENPYLQYFLGFERYEDRKPPFHATMLVFFRKRLSNDVLLSVNELIAKEAASEKPKKNKDDDEPKPPSPSGGPKKDEVNPNQGQLILDATCAPGDIRFPTDVRLLNEAREKLEVIIDVLHAPDAGQKKKPRTYRNEARANYLSLEKQRKKHKKAIRKVVRKQLGYVGRDLKIIDAYFAVVGRAERLSQIQSEHLETIRKVYEQQRMMYKTKTHSVPDRIVSITQPHMRPIVRGKAGADVEFGCKVMTSVVNGYSFIEHMSFDSFNEGSYLQLAVENYYSRFGYYPEAVMADTIFRNRANFAWLKERGIRMSGPKLGRPSKVLEKAHKFQEKIDTGIRNAVEGTYGNAKRKLGLDCIKAKRKDTAETVIALQFLVLNLERRLRVLLCQIANTILWLLRSRDLHRYTNPSIR